MKDYRHTKKDRILKRYEYLNLSKYGKRAHSKYFIAVFIKSRLNRNRLGITVTKKVGNAATRNRIKRLIREYFRLNKHSLRGFWDVNIIAKKEVSEVLSKGLVISSLDTLFRAIGHGYQFESGH